MKWLPAIIWTAIISYLSFSPLDQLSIPQGFGLDKLAHAFIYAVLVFLLSLPLHFRHPQFKVFVGLAIVYSGATELVQHYLIENRYGDVYDFAANLVGVSLALVIIYKRSKT